jgi:cardiolipin synthase
VGSALGAALTDRRILGPAEAGLLFLMAGVAIGVGILAAIWPRALAWPVAFIAMWSGIAWVVKGISLRRRKPAGPQVEQLEDALPGKVAPPAEEPSRESEAAPGDAGATRDRVT